MKPIWLFIVCVILSAGCRSNKGSKGISGQEQYAVDLAHSASVNAYNELKSYGAPIEPYAGWKITLIKRPDDYVWQGWPNAESATFGSNVIEYKGKIYGNLMHHEWKHIYLHRIGIAGHPKKYFPEGGTVHRN